MRSALLLVGVGVVAALASAPDGPRTAAPESPPEVAVAPMPRAVEDTRADRGDLERLARPADLAGAFEEMLGVRFKVTAKVRRLASTGRDVIDFDWRLEYAGPRPPLQILRPSLDDGWPGATTAEVCAFPKGKQEGRRAVFTAPGGDKRVAELCERGTPRDWFLTVPKGEAATGTTSLPVADVKAVLRGRYPDEFPDAVPPKLYVLFRHEPKDRGWGTDVDAWTGLLLGRDLELPDLKGW